MSFTRCAVRRRGATRVGRAVDAMEGAWDERRPGQDRKGKRRGYRYLFVTRKGKKNNRDRAVCAARET